MKNKVNKIIKEAQDSNNRAIVLLAEELNNKRLVIFLGAGCSISAGLPSWKDLIDNLIKKYKIKIKDNNLLLLATKLEKQLGTIKFRELIIENLQINPDVSTDLYDILRKLEVNLFITTNYDHLMEDTLKKYGHSPIIIKNDKDLPHINPSKKNIVKLHGDIDSPSSLIITSQDYARYKLQHNPFIEWLNSRLSEYTILFIGTSFEDLRLKEADEHVINLFGEFRRQPFIFLKISEKIKNMAQEKFEIVLEDFQILIDDFKNRGFYVILIKSYQEINLMLEKIHEESLSKKIQTSPSDYYLKYTLQSDYVSKLEKDIKKILDKKIVELTEWVRGNGILPTIPIILQRNNNLIQYIEKNYSSLSQESILQGLLTVIDTLLNSDKGTDIKKAREYYDKANKIFQKVSNPEGWQEKILRVKAKLFFIEGKINEAIKLIDHSKDNKTISLLLALLIDSNQLDKAHQFINIRKVHPQWVCEAIYILILTAHINEAEKIHHNIIKEYKELKKKNKLKDTPYENKSFYLKINFFMADALYRRALQITDKKEIHKIFLL